MQKQIDMQNAMLMAHRDFIKNLDESIASLEKEIELAREMSHICTDEWCLAAEGMIDELHKSIYSISEPRWAKKEDSERISKLRKKVKDLYLEFAQLRAQAA